MMNYAGGLGGSRTKFACNMKVLDSKLELFMMAHELGTTDQLIGALGPVRERAGVSGRNLRRMT